MLALVLSIICALLTVAVAFLVIGANMMSDAPTVGLQGGWVIAVPGVLTVLFFVVWCFGG